MNDIKDELLIQELEESVKQDRINQMWKDYGSYIMAGAALIVLVTAFVSFRGNYELKTNAHNTGMVLAALEEDKGAEKLSDVSGALKPGQRAIALMTAAGLHLQDQKYDDALALYKQMSGDKSLPGVFQDLGTLMMVRTEWAFGTEEKAPAVFLGRLKPFIDDESNPWRWHAGVQAAMIAAHGQKDYQKARKYLMPILGGADVPPSLLERARSLDHIYTLMQKEAKSSVPGETGSAKGTGEASKG